MESETELYRKVDELDAELNQEVDERRNKLIELMRESMRVERKDDNAMTTREMRQITGMSLKAIREILRELIIAGKVKAVKVDRKTLVGTKSPVWGYLFNEEQTD